ncbi:phage exclusion protein Lit family protein [Pedobacter frigoris]|uniref:Peptidase U49 n=1 Tax=Pedobacter frigoris TaxID=2571272 RepID=A0A4U1CGL1_9SPHI|nr:phage exclusion protein Lit family protein [Pedobacter frigoris]TKC04246.1 hypothetical protein FA047_16755 [Pedobacter frigoris]
MTNIHPIETLYDRLINTFENTSEITNARLREYQDSQLSRYIKIETGNFSTPYSDHDTKEIVLNKRFLCLMWCLNYIILEITQNKSRTAIKITDTYTVMDSEDTEVKELDQLFDWAFSLKNHNSNDEWPENLPNPTMTSYKVRTANVIFMDAVSYIMFHEVAHIVNGHWGSYKEISLKFKNRDVLNEQEKALCVQLEQEADTFAYECMVSSNDDEDTRYHKQLGIIMAGLSSMFALKAKTRLTSLTHPSIHIRVFNSRERTSFSEGNEFHLDRVMNVGLSMFCRLHGIQYEDQNFGSFNSLLDYFFNLLDASGTQELQH